MKPLALVFDAYGTLFDVHSVVALCDRYWPGKGVAVSQLWRTKQLEYTWQRSLMQRYVPFSSITEAGLRYACAAIGLDLSAAQQSALMQQYLKLSLYPDAKPALATLGGCKLAILSNGSPDMLDPVVAASGLDKVLDAVLSVAEVSVFKPDARVYQIAVDRLGVPKESIGFVSSNCWDACGAKAFGFRTYWINRAGAPLDALDATPDHTIALLTDLTALIG
ncbi:MAG: haloacid dehalogenase type II [Burkholderiales bacterium]|nr:haloacid dehalogenase type II [Burkholderiales bacterium]